MLSVGNQFPDFNLTAVNGTSPESFSSATLASYGADWKIIFFWPKDFTFVCPTEIAGFGKLEGEFKDRDAVLIGASTDSDFVHAAWRGVSHSAGWQYFVLECQKFID